MFIDKETEQVYFDELEPDVEEASIVPQIDLVKEQKKFESCFVPRNAPHSANIYSKRRISQVNIIKRQNNGTTQRHSTRLQLKRKMTFEGSNSPIKNSSPVYGGKPATPMNYRTIYISKKQNNHLESVSPEIATKQKRQSQSPNRRNLYWQSYLLEGKDPKKLNISTNTSDFFSQTLKSQRDDLPQLTAASYIAMMADTHQILTSKNLDQKRQIASLTKIMTAYTVIKICNTYGVKLREHKVSIHQQASWMEGTTANLKTGQEFFVIDLLYGLLLPSGNDAGVALAQHFGKLLSFKLTREKHQEDMEKSNEEFASQKQFYDLEYEKDSIRLFVFEMNKNSHKIGLKNTQFANPTGLSNSRNFSTVRDLALLTSHCLKNHLLREVFKKKIYTCQVVNEKLGYTKQVQWKNTNRHLYQFKQCIGVKTGITPTAGPCLSSAYRIMNREIVVIVLNSTSIEDRYQDARSIYKWCRRNMRIYT